MVTNHENMSTVQVNQTIEALSMPLFKISSFSLMWNVSFINNAFQFLAESMIFVFSWIELRSYVYASNDLFPTIEVFIYS